MTLTVTEAFHLPRPEEIQALRFVVKLQEADPSSDEVRQLVDDYVVTPAIERELPRILDGMKQVFDRGEDYGRFIHGSFGSGKSHFMTMLALLLEGAEPACRKFRGLLQAHRTHQQAAGQAGVDHEAWLRDAHLLVVRLHMLSARGKHTGLDRLVYEAFNQALKRRGRDSFHFLNVTAVFDEVRREAGDYGDVVWKHLEAAGIVGGREEFEALASGSEKARERFARAWLEYKGRDPQTAGIDPRWSDGLRRMAEHARTQGFRGIVLLIDEFLLWLAEKSGQEFVREINSLNVIVDHTTGQRPVPVFVFVARQRNLQEFFPDLVDETKIHEHLDHHAKRFEETRLQDVELRHIVKGRVLRPRHPEVVEQAVASLSERHDRILPALLAGADHGYLRDVYPFHPALIETLVDVTSLMQRERSALRLLYELLVLHCPDLPMGEFLPVGSAFEALFPEKGGVEASKKVETMQDIHRQYYERLRPAMQRMLEDRSSGFNEERRRALDQVVKTVLLGEVSNRLRRSGLTIDHLVQLNSVDVEGETFRGKVGVAETDLRMLSQQVPDLQLAGQGKTAIVRYNLGRVSLGEYLGRARSKVDNVAQRFKVFWVALKRALGIEGLRGFEENGANEGDWDLMWRRTRRRGRLRLGNVRETPYEDFNPGSAAFKVLVDYPWDESGHGVDEDRHRADNARKKYGTLYTACWLPRHMSGSELGVITELAAVRHLMSPEGQEDLLEVLGPQDRARLLEQASVRERSLAAQLDDLLREVYIEHGEFHALVNDIDRSRPRESLAENLEHIATLLMDRRYPQHPHFQAEPRRQDLELLLAWMVQAGASNVSVLYDEATGRVLRTLGQPLELANLGQTKASLRLDSRYIKDVLGRADQDVLAWGPIAEHLRDTYGFQPLLVDLFLCFLCQRDHRALDDSDGQPIEVRIGMPVGTAVRLQRGRLLSQVDWQRARDLGEHLLGVRNPQAHRSLQAQDACAAELVRLGRARRQALQDLHHRLTGLGIVEGGRLAELSEANRRLAPLETASTDSGAILEDLLARWPESPPGPLVAVVRQVGATREAVDRLAEKTRASLEAGRHHPGVREHLEELAGCLSATHQERLLDVPWIQAWNHRAQDLLNEIVASSAPRPAPQEARPDPSERRGPPPAPSRRERILLEAVVDPHDGDAVTGLLARVRGALQSEAGPPLKLVLTVVEAVE